jgi:hypothetical protein
MNFEKDYEIINFEKFKNYKKYIPLYNNPNDDFIIIDLLNNSNDRINNIFNKEKVIERTIQYDYKEWYDDIKNSFKDEKDINKQFHLDFNRTLLFINGNSIKKYNELIEFLECTIDKKNLLDILMFSTQASLGLPYCIIQKNIYMDKEEYFLAGLDSSEKEYNEDNRINIELNNEINITIEKKLRIVKFIDNDPVTKCYVNIFISFNLNSKMIDFNFYFVPKIIMN